MKVLYIFPGKRPKVSGPATQQYGYNHLKSLGINVDSVGRDDALPAWLLNGPLANLIGFKLRHTLLYFKARNYDIVFGPTLLYLMPLKKLFGGRARYLALNIELVRIARGCEGKRLHSWFITLLFKELSAIVCLSTDQKEWLLLRYPFLKGKVFYVPLGADTRFYTPTYEGRNETVLSVGKDNGRDYGTFIETARQMSSTKFEIVCSPRNMAGITNIPSNVHIYYDLPLADLVKKYQTAQMIVISTHSDSSTAGADCSGQTVLLDAMANGLPIIVTRKAYLADYVRDGEDALIVPSADSKALADAIHRLNRDGILRQSLAEHARERVEDDLSSNKTAVGLVNIFNWVNKQVA